MKESKIKKTIILVLLILTTAFLAGCNGDNNESNNIRPPFDPEKRALIEKLRENEIMKLREQNLTQEELENNEEITIEYEPELEIICPEEYSFNEQTNTCQKSIEETTTQCSEGEYDENENACIIKVEIEYEPTCASGELVEKDGEYKCLVSSKQIIQKCGDNVCDTFEQENPNVCPIDCQNINQTTEETIDETEEETIEETKNETEEENQETKQLNSKSRFGFLAAYGQTNPDVYLNWQSREEQLNLIDESSKLMNELQASWTRMTFTYPNELETQFRGYGKEKLEKAIEDGLNIMVTILVEDQYKTIEYDEWLKNQVIKYSNNIKVWQLQNEVGKESRFANPEEYIDFVKKSSEIIKYNCNECFIMMGSMGPDEEYYSYVIENGDDYVDLYDFHIFDQEDSQTYQKFMIERINKPLFITEMSTHSGLPKTSREVSFQSEKDQAEMLIKWHLEAFAQGADYIFWSQFVEWYKFAGIIDGTYDLTGLVYNGMCLATEENKECPKEIDKGALVKKEAYQSLKTLIQKIDNFETIEKIDETKYKTTRNGKTTYTLWCENEINCELPSELLNKQLKVTTYKGIEEIKQSSEIVLTNSPIFIE